MTIEYAMFHAEVAVEFRFTIKTNRRENDAPKYVNPKLLVEN